MLAPLTNSFVPSPNPLMATLWTEGIVVFLVAMPHFD